MSRYYRHNPDEPIRHDWTRGGQPTASSNSNASPPDSPDRGTSYFTFGQSHAHVVNLNGALVTLDRDVVLKITSEDPRQTMFDLCGAKWAMQYDEPPDMRHFPRGIIEYEP